MKASRGWENPAEYTLHQNQEFKKTAEWQRSIFLLALVYQGAVKLFKIAPGLNEKQALELNSHYRKLVDFLEDLLVLDCLAYLKLYCPKLSGTLEVNEWDWEHELWYLDDLENFQKILKNEIAGLDYRGYTIPQGLVSEIKEINRLLSEHKNDTEILGDLEAKYEYLEGTGEGKLTIHTNGTIAYTSTSGKTYTAKFSTKSNSYKFLDYLANKPFNNISFDEIASILNEPKISAETPSEERRTRDTATSIRKKLKIPKNEKFLKADYGFGLYCKVERRSD